MEKISFLLNKKVDDYYRASEVDALLSDVRALVTIAKTVDPVLDMLNSARTDARTATEILMTWQNVFLVVSNLEKAIAAVEARLK